MRVEFAAEVSAGVKGVIANVVFMQALSEMQYPAPVAPALQRRYATHLSKLVAEFIVK